MDRRTEAGAVQGQADVSGAKASHERTWTIWRCDNCGDFPEVELGEECEFCCEGRQTEFEVVEASRLAATESELERVREAQFTENELAWIASWAWDLEGAVPDAVKARCSKLRAALSSTGGAPGEGAGDG